MNFQRIGVLTVLSVFLLIFVGGVVRSTGSGMGCPDWPKCFGSYIPPVSIDQLPLNYQEIYGAKLKGEIIFNPVKTWIEYLNRLLGALIGLFVFLTFLYSTKFWKTDKLVVIWSGIAVLLTGFQGWVGSKVVSSELMTYMVTIHMIIAIVIVAVLLYVLFRAYYYKKLKLLSNTNFNSNYLVVVFILTLTQILLGTQVRESIDIISKSLGENSRSFWIENVGIKFIVHRSFSLLVLILHYFLFLYSKKTFVQGSLGYKFSYFIVLLVLIEIFSGIGLNYFGFPAFIQPLHLTLAVVLLGIQMVLIFALNPKFFKGRLEY